MSELCAKETTECWGRLVSVSARLLQKIEAELKSNDLPQLTWYDALLEIGRAGDGGIRPSQLQKELLLAQYNLSRLLERMVKAGVIERAPCCKDKRACTVSLTKDGKDLKKRMWAVYGKALEKHFGEKLSVQETQSLARLLSKLE